MNTRAHEIAAQLNAHESLSANVWQVPGRGWARVYVTYTASTGLEHDAGWIYVPARGEPDLSGLSHRAGRNAVKAALAGAPAADPVPTADDPAFHAAVRRGDAALHGSDDDLLDAVRSGHVSVSDAMNQDF